MAGHPSGYAKPDALWVAVRDRIKAIAPGAGPRQGELQRQFVYDRFLARVFTHAADGSWVLKGGIALLARVRSARHSRDIDLFRRDGLLDAAIAEIKAAVATDLGDHLRFQAGPVEMRPERGEQPGKDLATIPVECYAGVRRIAGFTVDVVVGGIITGEPEVRVTEPVVAIGGLVTPPYRLYPVVDHIADKVCATVELHGSHRASSSRHRDLVDLVVIARTQTVDADALRLAVTVEAEHRGLPPITRWQPPAAWASGYARAARDVAECRDHRAFAAASAFVGGFLDPVLADGLTDATWQPTELRWRRTDS